jgi:hypothetical protein
MSGCDGSNARRNDSFIGGNKLAINRDAARGIESKKNPPNVRTFIRRKYHDEYAARKDHSNPGHRWL